MSASNNSSSSSEDNLVNVDSTALASVDAETVEVHEVPGRPKHAGGRPRKGMKKNRAPRTTPIVKRIFKKSWSPITKDGIRASVRNKESRMGTIAKTSPSKLNIPELVSGLTKFPDAKRRRILGPRTQKEQENYDRIKPRTTNDMSIAELDDNIASIEELDEIQVLSPDPPFELPMQIRTESKIISDMLKEAVEKTYSKMEYDYVIGLNTTVPSTKNIVQVASDDLKDFTTQWNGVNGISPSDEKIIGQFEESLTLQVMGQCSDALRFQFAESKIKGNNVPEMASFMTNFLRTFIKNCSKIRFEDEVLSAEPSLKITTNDIPLGFEDIGSSILGKFVSEKWIAMCGVQLVYREGLSILSDNYTANVVDVICSKTVEEAMNIQKDPYIYYIPNHLFQANLQSDRDAPELEKIAKDLLKLWLRISRPKHQKKTLNEAVVFTTIHNEISGNWLLIKISLSGRKFEFFDPLQRPTSLGYENKPKSKKKVPTVEDELLKKTNEFTMNFMLDVMLFMKEAIGSGDNEWLDVRYPSWPDKEISLQIATLPAQSNPNASGPIVCQAFELMVLDNSSNVFPIESVDGSGNFEPVRRRHFLLCQPEFERTELSTS